MFHCSFMSEGSRSNIITLFRFLSFVFLLFVFSGMVSAELTIERIKPKARVVDAKPGKKFEFKVKAKSSSKIVYPIDKIEFSATENPEVDGEESKWPWFSRDELEHKVKYKWGEDVWEAKVTATVYSKNQTAKSASVSWTVQVGGTQQKVPEANEPLEPPNIRIKPEAQNSEWVRIGGPLDWYRVVGNHRLDVGEGMTFEVKATSKDGIASIKFEADDQASSTKYSFQHPKTTWFFKAPSHTMNYSWRTSGSKEVTATVVTLAGAEEKLKWTIEVWDPSPVNPDLVVEPISVSKDTLAPGGSFTLTATVQNQGKAASQSTTLRFYSSLDPSISTNDPELRTAYIGPLNAGGQIIRQKRLTAPDEPGVYYYGVCVDSAQRESYTSNNCSEVVVITVQAPALPDLVVESISVSDNVVDPGESFTLYVTVRNQGTATSLPTMLSYHDPNGGQIGTDRIGRLLPSVESKQSISLRAPEKVGTYYYDACVESPLRSDESNLDNNCSVELAITVGTPTIKFSGQGSFQVGDSIVVQNASGGGLNGLLVRSGAGTRFAPVASAFNGATGTITDGPEDNGGYRRWKVLWDASDQVHCDVNPCEGWVVESFNGSDVIAKRTNQESVDRNLSRDEEESFDFTIQSVATNKIVLASGENFRLEAIVLNQGGADAPSTYLRYYRSLDSTISVNDTEVGADRITTPDAGETYDRGENLTAPDTPGVYYYGACVDSVSGESNMDNNCSEPVRITVQTARSPDLVIRSISADKVGLEPGERFTVTAIVLNQGIGNSRSTALRYYRSSDTHISTGDTEVNTRSIRALEASETYEVSKTLWAPDTPGVYYYGACVDSVQSESHTENNCSESVRITVSAMPVSVPDLVVSLSVDENIVDRSEEFQLNAAVRNQGTGETSSTRLRYYLSTDSTLSPDDTELWVDRVGALDPGEVDNEDEYVNAPEEPGLYYYIACVDSVEDESSTDNNCASIPITVLIRDTGVCDRTLPVLEEILAETDIEDCADVESAALAAITSLGLHNSGITTLQASDFQGLSGLDDLDLSDNSLSSLSVGIFDGLGALEYLYLGVNSLRVLPVGIFNQLDALYYLNLSDNALSSLSVGVFDGLGVLDQLYLEENSLSTLPVDIFAELTSLTELDLESNGLRSLPVGVFNGLSALDDLDLSDNSLGTLPVGVFDGLDALETLDLEGNQLTTLPKGLFDDVLDTLHSRGSDGLEVDAALKATLSFSTTVQDVQEGETVRVAVSLSPALPVAIRVPYAVGGTATVDDYTNLQPLNELLFLAGETSKEITFTVVTDADTSAETVSLILSELPDVKLRQSNGSGPDSDLWAGVLLNPVLQRNHTVTITTDGSDVSRPMYWTDGSRQIRRSQLDGTQVQTLVTTIGSPPWQIALDVSGDKMYWTAPGPDKIQRADLNGTNVEDLVTDLPNPVGIALDVSDGKMYWTALGPDKIQRADLNGTNVEDLVTGLDQPLGIALDVSGGKMYWTDKGTDKIQRADLNGTNVEDLVTSLGNPRGIALDVSGGKMYWTDSGTDKIQRADLNGTNIEDLVTHMNIGADQLALDVAAGKMYWADSEEDKICRANLDGTEVEELFSGSGSYHPPIGIALAVSSSAAAPAAPLGVSRNLAALPPERIMLFPNYPNPFNPETWIPYQLSEPADVSISIYAIDGQLVRTLGLGHQSIGIYESRSRAAYWDGRNALGEPVASGVYFYTLTAGDFNATRKMLIRK